jgi:hypothetical protein
MLKSLAIAATFGLVSLSPALAGPNFGGFKPSVCGNDRHVGNPFCDNDEDGDDYEQNRDANIVATYESGHFCNIDGSDVLIETAFISPGQASGTDNTLSISQNGPTVWSLDTVTSTGENLAGSDSGFAVTSSEGLDLDARLGEDAGQIVNGVYSDDGVTIVANITDDGGVFQAGGYRIQTTLRCVSGDN